MPDLLEETEATVNCEVAAREFPRGGLQRLTVRRRLALSAARVLTRCFGPRQKDAFGILMYHRITDSVPGFSPPTWNVPPAIFERQLRGLLRRGWRPLRLRTA